MKKFILKSIFYTILIGGLSACGTSYYAPGVQRAPILQEEGEITLAASGTVYSQSISNDFHAAYSPKQNLGVMVNANLFDPQATQNNLDNTTFYRGMKGKYIEAAAGYYIVVGAKASFEFYGGYGRLFDGRTNTNFNRNLVSNFEYNRFFIQPAFGYRGDIFEIIPSVRISRIDFAKVEPPTTDPNNNWFFNPVSNGDTYVMFEPSVTMGLGYKYLKFQLSLGTSFNFLYNDFEYEPIALSAGILFNLKPSFKKKTEEDTSDLYYK